MLFNGKLVVQTLRLKISKYMIIAQTAHDNVTSYNFIPNWKCHVHIVFKVVSAIEKCPLQVQSVIERFCCMLISLKRRPLYPRHLFILGNNMGYQWCPLWAYIIELHETYLLHSLSTEIRTQTTVSKQKSNSSSKSHTKFLSIWHKRKIRMLSKKQTKSC